MVNLMGALHLPFAVRPMSRPMLGMTVGASAGSSPAGARPAGLLPGACGMTVSSPGSGRGVLVGRRRRQLVTDVEPIQLGALQREAAAADARTREVELLARQTRPSAAQHRRRALPSVSALGQSQLRV